MTARLRGATQSKKSSTTTATISNLNNNKINKNGRGERGNVDNGVIIIQSQSMTDSSDAVVFDIASAYPIIPPRTSSFAARGTGFESDVHAAMMASATLNVAESPSGNYPSLAAAAGVSNTGSAAAVTGSASLPAGRQGAVATPPPPPPPPLLSHTPCAAMDDTSAMSTPGAGTSAALPTPATTPTGNNTLLMTDGDHAQSLAPQTPDQHLGASRSGGHHHSAGSSQASLSATHSSVSRSPAAHPSSLATSWTNEGNTDGSSGHGHGGGDHDEDAHADDRPVKEGETEVDLDEEVEESMIRSGEVIDLVGGDGEEVGRLGPDSERERESEDVWLRGRTREKTLVSHSPSPAQVETGSRTAEGEGYTEGDHVVPMGTTTEAVSVWHPLGDDPLSKEDPSQLLPEADHDVRPDSPPAQAQEQAQEVADTQRASSIQFSEGCSFGVDEKRGHVRRQQSSLKLSASEKLEQLRLRLKAPQSPQPWDAIDRLVVSDARSQGGYQEPKDGEKEKEHGAHEPLGSDYYSTLTSKNFATMQKRYASVFFLFRSFALSSAPSSPSCPPPLPISSHIFSYSYDCALVLILHGFTN